MGLIMMGCFALIPLLYLVFQQKCVVIAKEPPSAKGSSWRGRTGINLNYR
jgi:hypothetical protein